MKRSLMRAAAGLGSAALLLAAACSDGKDDKSALGDNGSLAPRTADGGPISPEVAGVAAPAVDNTPEPVDDPRQVVGTVAVPESVERGKTATLTFRTRPGSSCQVEMKLANTNGDGGVRLPSAVANDAGLVSWAWNVGAGIDPGTATAYVVCSGGQRGQADLRIS